MLSVLTAVEENPREQEELLELLEEVAAAWLCSGHAGSCMWDQKPGRRGLSLFPRTGAAVGPWLSSALGSCFRKWASPQGTERSCVHEWFTSDCFLSRDPQATKCAPARLGVSSSWPFQGQSLEQLLFFSWVEETLGRLSEHNSRQFSDPGRARFMVACLSFSFCKMGTVLPSRIKTS